MKRGLFIALEGGEGSGKSTLAQGLASLLSQKNIEYIQTREPGGCALAEQLRQLLLHSQHSICSKAELLLFLAARAQHVAEKVEPALSAGKLVLCDRFHASTAVYQGLGRGLGMDSVLDMSLWAADQLTPDLTIYLDIAPAIARKRLQKRGQNADRIETAGEAFHLQVATGFKQLFSSPQFLGRSIICDAAQSSDVVLATTWEAIKTILQD